jgi:hypothetical protein
MRDVAVLSCAYNFKVLACFMLHADTRFSRHRLISKLNQCMRRIVFFLRIDLFKHGYSYSLILVLGMKRILFFTNGLIKLQVKTHSCFAHETDFIL